MQSFQRTKPKASVKTFTGISRRHPDAPRYWLECGLSSTVKAGREYSALLPAQWALVLNSKDIPFKIVRQRGMTLLYVSPLQAGQACAEIAAFLREPPLKPKTRPAPARAVDFRPIFAALLGLTLWHALRMGWWGGLGISPEGWVQAGALSAAKLIQGGEWYRAVTALTLHADAQHLLGNVIFGGIALTVLALRVGSISALSLTFFSGIMGNLLAAFLRMGGDYSSIGSSTALFGTMGILCGLAIAMRDISGWRRIFFPLAAGLAWLAFLGTEGVRVDILAHVTGLSCGVAVGLFVPAVFKGTAIPARATWVMAASSVLILAISWLLAF